MSIQVGVRVRPFNTREKDHQSECIIEMPGQNQTKIKDETGKERTFTFDHSFWSHDGYRVLDDGYLQPVEENYADQKKVFDAVGRQILENAWEGYHCCLFAYGQTGSGKSYSMVGYGANKGIIPISCDEIFKRIGENQEKDKTYEVQVSMLEIYNEKVQDLLIRPDKRPQGGLKIRESKVLGIFVEGLTKYPVTSYEEISKKMDEGYNNRTIGSTLMNATSSRAHTIVTIEFRQITMFAKRKSEKLSMINLVDLAGSERSGATGATGDRLKEGCNINRSLLILGNVINCLADKAIGKNKNMLPPYRDSALTRILQNALGGNSKTVMICALSPATINYEETLSTLRYADRAKKIQNKAVINESEHDKMVRLLKEENVGLKKMIEDLQKKLLGQGGVVGDDDKQAFLDLKEQYEANQKVMSEMQKTFTEKLEEAKKSEGEYIGSQVDISLPHLVVLNEDPQLSHKLRYQLSDLPVYVGRKHGNPPPQIILSGIGISLNHAIFEKDGDDILLKANDDKALEHIFINGKKISRKGQIIQNKDRIIFGTNTIFIYMKSSKGDDIYDIDWETAQNELESYRIKEKEENEKRKQDEYNLMKKNLEEEYAKKRKEMEDELKKKMEECQNQMKEMNESVEKQKIEQERLEEEQKLKIKMEQLEDEKIRKRREFEIKERNELAKLEQTKKESEIIRKNEKLEMNLTIIMKKLSKLNIIIKEFKRNIKMDIQLHNNTIEEGEDKTQTILIRVENYEEGTVYYWTPETFHNRFDLMSDLFERYYDNDLDLATITKEEDPLWDEPTHSLLGYAFYKCEPICYLMSNPSSISIISPDGNIMGQLDVDIIPHDENDNEYDEVPESPSELIGQSICFKVCIIGVKNLPVNFCRNLKVEYQTFYDKQVNYTKLYNEDNSNLTEFKIGEEIEHRIDYITKEDVEFLEKEKLCFKVYAYEDVEKKGKADVDEVLKIDKEIEQQLEEPAEVIPKNIKNMSDNFNNNNKINIQNNNNNNRVNRNKFGYSNNQQNLNKINPKITNSQMEKYGKGKNDKDCSIF